MIILPTPQRNLPAEVFYAADGRLVIDYKNVNNRDPMPEYHTFVYNHGSEEWDSYHVRVQEIPVFGIKNPWDAAVMPSEEVIHSMDMKITLTEHDFLRMRAADHEPNFIYNYAFLNGVNYGYHYVRAYAAGLWVEMFNSSNNMQHRVVCKVRLPHEWWKSKEVRNSTFKGEWTHHPSENQPDSTMICCPDFTRHVRANGFSVFDGHGNRYETPKGSYITHAVLRGPHLIIALNKSGYGSPSLSTMPRVSSYTRPACSLVFLDPNNLSVIKEMELVPPECKSDRTRFYLLAISPDLCKVAAVGSYYFREIDLE